MSCEVAGKLEDCFLISFVFDLCASRISGSLVLPYFRIYAEL